MRAHLIGAIILAGAWASTTHWDLALPLITAWGLLFIVYLTSLQRQTRMVMVLTLSQSLFSIFVTLAPKMPYQLCVGIGTTLIAVCLISLIRHRNIKHVWVGVSGLAGFVLLAASVTHLVINSMLDKPFDGSIWAPTAWAAVSFTVAFVFDDEQSISDSMKRLPIAIPIMIGLVFTVHYFQADALKIKTGSVEPAEVARRAFSKGYDEVGNRAAWLETDRLLATQGVGAAVSYMRQQWRHLDKTYFIAERRDLWNGRTNLYFMVLCFGVQLRLNDNERVIDGAVDAASETIFVLTSQDRLLAIQKEGVNFVSVNRLNAIAIHANQHGAALLCEGHAVILENEQQSRIVLNGPHSATDISLSRDGQRCLVLFGSGRVDEYQKNQENDWAFHRTRYKPLWKEPDAAVAFHVGNDDSAYILTRNGGVHYHDDAVFNRELSPFWDPNRAAMRDLGFEPGSNQVFVMDDFGRLDFIDLDHAPTTVQPVAAGWPSLPAPIQFDRANAVWSATPNRAALAVVSNADTALQFLSNGFIQAIALPQGARIIYRRGELKLDAQILVSD